jgi:transketolase
MLYQAQSGHPGGALSIVDMLVVLFYKIMQRRPKEPSWPDRDRFILSKGHSCPSLYVVLADQGYFAEDELWSLRKENAMLQGHPDMQKIPGIDITTGSLGQGLSAGMGMALGAKIDRKAYKTFVILGDGECQEGQIWEAAMAASHFQVGNLVALVDYNGLQVDGSTHDILSLEPLVNKWKAFNWEVYPVDGHNIAQLYTTLLQCRESQSHFPKVLIANTTKGKGVSYMENQVAWHCKAMTSDEFEQAVSELQGDNYDK